MSEILRITLCFGMQAVASDAHLFSVLARIELLVYNCTCIFCFASKAVEAGTSGPETFWGGKKEVSAAGGNVADWTQKFHPKPLDSGIDLPLVWQ